MELIIRNPKTNSVTTYSPTYLRTEARRLVKEHAASFNGKFTMHAFNVEVVENVGVRLHVSYRSANGDGGFVTQAL